MCTVLGSKNQKMDLVMSSRSHQMMTWIGVGITLCLLTCPSPNLMGQQMRVAVSYI